MGKGFWDFQGVWRDDGDGYLDFKNVYRLPGDMFLDARCIYRKPGDYFYDKEDVPRAPGSGFLDANGSFRIRSLTSESVEIKKETKKEEKPKEEPIYEKIKGESFKEMQERIKRQAKEDINNGKEIKVYKDNRPPLTKQEKKDLYFKHYFIMDVKEALGKIGIFLLLCLVFFGISYLLTIIEYKELFKANSFKLLYLPTIISFVILIIIIVLYRLKKYFENKFQTIYFIMVLIAIVLLEIFGWRTYDTIEKIFLPIYGFSVSLIPSGIIYSIIAIKEKIEYPPY